MPIERSRFVRFTFLVDNRQPSSLSKVLSTFLYCFTFLREMLWIEQNRTKSGERIET